MVKSRPTPTEKRLIRLGKRVEREVYIFPDKHDSATNRLVKAARKPRRRSLKEQMDDLKKFQEMTE